VTGYVLESAAAEFVHAAAHAPPVYELTRSAARTSLEDIQSGPIARPDVDSAERRCLRGRDQKGQSDD